MSDYSTINGKTNYNQTVVEASNTTKKGGGTEGKNSNSRGSSKGTSSSDGSKSAESSSKESAASSARGSSKQNSNAAGTSHSEAETVRNLVTTTVSSNRTAEKANIGCQISFTVRIRGGMPLSTNAKSPC